MTLVYILISLTMLSCGNSEETKESSNAVVIEEVLSSDVEVESEATTEHEEPPNAFELGYYLINHSEELFFDSEQAVINSLSDVEKSELNRIRDVLLKLWLQHITMKIEQHAPYQDFYDGISVSAEALKSTVLTQRKVSHAPLGQHLLMRAMYGLSWCDGINHLFGAILSQVFQKEFSLWGLLDIETGSSPHTLLQHHVGESRYYLDAWGDTVAFSLGEGFSVPNYFKAALDDTTLYNHIFYLDGWQKIHITPLDLGPWNDKSFQLVHGNAPSCAMISNPKKRYLYSRLHHLFDDTQQATTYYRCTLEICDSTEAYCRAARVFLDTLETR